MSKREPRSSQFLPPRSRRRRLKPTLEGWLIGLLLLAGIVNMVWAIVARIG